MTASLSLRSGKMLGARRRPRAQMRHRGAAEGQALAAAVVGAQEPRGAVVAARVASLGRRLRAEKQTARSPRRRLHPPPLPPRQRRQPSLPALPCAKWTPLTQTQPHRPRRQPLRPRLSSWVYLRRRLQQQQQRLVRPSPEVASSRLQSPPSSSPRQRLARPAVAEEGVAVTAVVPARRSRASLPRLPPQTRPPPPRPQLRL